ncbi:hypothetical protein BDZ89DRAFT_555252 [Hymenopellis radicata]|nr:hypothetical protein BDZ89DRAFT_555252 [Hymenopellis radicata]
MSSLCQFHDVALAYIDNLPNEVLTHIFRLLARSVEFFHDSGLAVCVTLLKVCRRWHALIMDDGFLWSFVQTTVKQSSLFDTCHRVQRQLERARSWPLHVHEYTLLKDVPILVFCRM